ncbi:MAG: hypothetical protein J5518_03300 [Lachnospiraceae bacterium]|nr:hypothetical protein [Lachnospiraceae bacterium]
MYLRSLKRLCGSMTVELTLLMPFLIGVFLFLFFSLYYLHDIAAIQKGCSAALIRGSLIRDDTEARREMQEAMEEIRLLGKWDLEKSIRIDREKVSVAVKGNMNVREGLFLKLIRDRYVYETSMSTERIDETAYIRSKRR